MSKCCGEDRDTPFCPICGDSLQPVHPLLEVLEYVRRGAKNSETRYTHQIANHRAAFKRMPDYSYNNERADWLEERRELARTRWKSWEDAIMEALSHVQ